MINLILGDCLEKMQDIESGSVDAIICDLPYGKTQNKWDSVIDLDLMWIQFKRITKPSSPVILFSQTPFDKVLGCSNLPMLKYEIIWEKTSATGHFNAKKMPMKAHENILVFYKKLPTYNPQKTKGHKRKTSKTGKTYDSDCYGDETAKPHYDSTERYPRSIQTFSSDKQTKNFHSTQKPLALMEYLIKTYTNEGDAILDAAMGSGTTMVAAQNLNRNGIGIELDEAYFKIAQGRINT